LKERREVGNENFHIFPIVTLHARNFVTRNANQHLTPVFCALCASCGAQQQACSTLGFVADCIIKDDLLTVKENSIAAQTFTPVEIKLCSHAVHYDVGVDNNRAMVFCCSVNNLAIEIIKTRLLLLFLI
jgi:hypothetical protein